MLKVESRRRESALGKRESVGCFLRAPTSEKWGTYDMVDANNGFSGCVVSLGGRFSMKERGQGLHCQAALCPAEPQQDPSKCN